jgi:hypothetical protein
MNTFIKNTEGEKRAGLVEELENKDNDKKLSKIYNNEVLL